MGRRKTLRGMINVTIGKEEMEEMGETEGTVEIETIEEEMDPREMATERMNQEMMRKLEKEKKNTRVNERITRMREGMKVEVREEMNIGEMKGRMIIEVENVETSMLRIGRRTRGMIETTGDRRTIRKIQRTMARKMKQKRSGGKLIRRKTLRGMINVTIGKEEMKV